MSDSNSILKSTVSTAVTAAKDAIQPLQLDLEAHLVSVGDLIGRDKAQLVHDEMLNQLGVADSLLGTGTYHTDTGGTPGKGGSS